MKQQDLFSGLEDAAAAAKGKPRRRSPRSASTSARSAARQSLARFIEKLRGFDAFGTPTLVTSTSITGVPGHLELLVPTFVNEYWSSGQREASRLHEVSYRACFKPQLPRFFIEALTRPGDRVYDPFMGRGTTPIEAALLGRVPVACDVNPLSTRLTRPRLHPPTAEEVKQRLGEIPFDQASELQEDLLVFYHPKTLRAITSLKQYLLRRLDSGTYDPVDDWISMVALNRLTGHSVGFFSVYTLPPNQAASVRRQRIINEKRGQVPPVRDVPGIILKKTRQLLSDLTPESRERLAGVAPGGMLLTSPCSATPGIPGDSVDLVVTSPPFLSVVQYAADNWLRCWFLGIDPATVAITQTSSLKAWKEAMTGVFRELYRVVKPGGWVAFEVGEVSGGKVKLEEASVPCGVAAGFSPELILINAQEFTKTANCWGIGNNAKGTNTNRVILFSRS
ncbi:MAG TPA: DNA modification methylase [Verrucomicrobiales bacterium]|nr:DNA modification methylase [Verrucomicrobiales bacterium]